VGWWDIKNSLLRLSALFSTSLDPSNEMSDSVGWLLLSYLQLVYLLVCSIAKSLTERDRILPINSKMLEFVSTLRERLSTFLYFLCVRIVILQR
jgi:hypothetical protein